MRTIALLMVALLVLLLTAVPVMAAQPAGKGPDQYGYNYQARLFNGLFGNADENRPCGDGNPDTFCGASTDSYGYYDTDGYFHKVVVNVAGTHLGMKWSEAWHMAVFGPDNIRYNGDEIAWSVAGPDAWLTNQVVGTGTIYDTDGTTVLYQGHLTVLSKIRWVGDTTGYTNPIWGQFAVLQKVISGPGQGFQEIPCGFGPPLP